MVAETRLNLTTYAATAVWLAVRYCCACCSLCAISCAVILAAGLSVSCPTSPDTVEKTPASFWWSISHLTNCASTAWPCGVGPPQPRLSRWLLPLVAHRTSHRFATTNARRETNASRTTTAPRTLRSGGGRQGACQRPPFPLGRCHAPCFSPAALPLRSGKDKIS